MPRRACVSIQPFGSLLVRGCVLPDSNHARTISNMSFTLIDDDGRWVFFQQRLQPAPFPIGAAVVRNVGRVPPHLAYSQLVISAAQLLYNGTYQSVCPVLLATLHVCIR
jgi:hypothetical protein